MQLEFEHWFLDHYIVTDCDGDQLTVQHYSTVYLEEHKESVIETINSLTTKSSLANSQAKYLNDKKS